MNSSPRSRPSFGGCSVAGGTEYFTIDTREPEQSFDITARVREAVERAGLARGLCHVMVLHSPAAIVVNETADPNIGADVIRALGSWIPTRHDCPHDLKYHPAHPPLERPTLGPS